MSKTITTPDEIPPAPYYVLSDDSFMSDWGQAEGRLNTIILPCADRAEAETVATNARNRDEQRNVRVLDHKPRLSSGVVYSLLTREKAFMWYQPGGFEPPVTDQPYNGWTNYKTWATDLWLTNDEQSYKNVQTAVAAGGAAALRKYVHDLPDVIRGLSGQVPDSGLVADLFGEEHLNARETRSQGEIVRDALAKVNWDEIAASLGAE